MSDGPSNALIRELSRRAALIPQQRGIVTPNPGSVRIRPLPGVMADPPTVTTPAGNTASAITTLNGAVGAGIDLASTIGDNGTATSATSTTLTQTGKNWGTANQYRGYDVTIWSGTGAGQIRTIASHTADTLTVDDPWDVTPDNTSVYGFWNVRKHRDWSYRHADMIVHIANPATSGFTTNRGDVNSTVRADTLPIGSGRYWICFTHWGDQFEIRHRGAVGNQFRIMVDNNYVQYTPYASTSGDNLIYRTRVDFANGETDAATRATFRAMRNIVIECAASFSFMGLTIGPTDSVWAPTDPTTPKAVMMTDSYGNTGSLAVFTAFGDTLAKLLGIPWMQITPAGGTGYVATNGGTSPTFVERYQADIVDRDPDIVFIYGSQNDGGLAGIYTAARTVHAGVRAGVGATVPVIVFGPSPVTGGPGATTILSRDDNMRAGLDSLAAGDINFYVDIFGGPYPYSGSTSDYVGTGLIRGFGIKNTPTHSGNRDDYYGGTTGSDNSHPTQDGHDAYAYFYAHAFSEWVDAGCPQAYWQPGRGLVVV